jgi:outer membrane protein assembly factor BamB
MPDYTLFLGAESGRKEPQEQLPLEDIIGLGNVPRGVIVVQPSRLAPFLFALAAMACGGRVRDSSGDPGAKPDPFDSGPSTTATQGDASARDATTGDAVDAAQGSDDTGDTGAAASTATSYLVNPAHTNAVSDSALTAPLTLLWSLDRMADSHASYPLIAGGLVYIVLDGSTGSGGLVALDQATGTTRWGPVDLGKAFPVGHAYDAGRIFVGTSDSYVRAYDGATGANLWSTQVPAGTTFSGPPTAYRGIVYLAAEGEVDALDEATGAILWSVPVDGSSATTSPAVTDDGVFVSYACAETYALERRTGSALWNHPGCGNNGPGAPPAVFQGRVYVMDQSDGPTILDAHTGDVVGHFTSVTYPAFDGTRGFFNQRTPLYGVNLPAVQNAWSFSGDGELNLTPIVVGGTVYVVSDSGKIFAVDEATGAQVWSAQVRNLGAPGSLGAGEGVLVVVGYDGYSGISVYAHAAQGDAGSLFGVATDGGIPPPQMLSGTEQGPQSLALDTTTVYWTNYSGGEIRKVAKSGGQPVTVYSKSSTYPWGIAVDSRNLYWTVPNFFTGGVAAAAMTLPLAGGSPTALATDPVGPQAIVVGGNEVYWTETGSVAVRAALVDGGSEQTFATGPGGQPALAIDATNLYWSTTDHTYEAPLGGGTAIAIGPSASAIAVDVTDVYLARNTTLGVGVIARVPIGGGSQTALATGRTGGMVAIAIDSRNVYWIEGEGTIQQGAVVGMPKSGGVPTVLASGMSITSAIAVDDTAVYFTTPSQIAKILKGP